MATAQDIGVAVATALSAALKPVLDALAQKSSPQHMVDTRGIGRPPSFDGAEKVWREWKGKLLAYLYATAPQGKPYLDWAELCDAPITLQAMEAQCADGSGNVNQNNLDSMCQFSTRLFLILVDTCKGEPYRIVESAGHGNGLEAWRLLMRRYASRTPGTKRALLASLFAMKPATSATDFESVLLTVEEIIRRYDAMAASKMPEDIQCAILIAVCPKDLKEFLDMSTDDFKYSDLRQRATNWIERKRDSSAKQITDMERRQGGGPAPMDVSWFSEWESNDQWHDAEVHEVQDWGGYPSQWSPSQTGEGVHYMNKGSKGKSKGKGKGVSSGKGKSGQKGLPSSRGFPKGSSRGAGQFQGECHYCGKWGHPIRECQMKDRDMAMARQRQGTYAGNVEENGSAACHENEGDQLVSGLESARRSMGPWELSGVSARSRRVSRPRVQSLGARIDRNSFAALSSDEEEASVPLAPTSTACLADYPWRIKVAQGTRKKWKRRIGQLPPVREESEISNLDVGGGPDLPQSDVASPSSRQVVLTIDSGAAEHVVGPKDLPHVRVTPSHRYVQYTMANGHKTSNRGEQRVSAVTSQGQEVEFKAQVTDVHRPLMSVSRICDRGNRVVFEAQGGYIESLSSGEKIHVQRDQNVYRLQVEVPGTGFSRPGWSSHRP